MDTLNHITLNGVTKYVKDSAGQAMLAPEELTLTAANAYAVGDLFRYDGKLYKASAAIGVGDTIEVGTNCEETTIAGENIRDVQVNGTSIVQNGVANIPKASGNVYGAVRTYDLYGTQIVNGSLAINPAGETNYRNKTGTYKAVVGETLHKAVFWGLANASGDTTQSASSNTVGNYTDNAKASIKAMLGIQDGSTGTVDVTGTTPTIAAVENTRYVCGEVTSLNFTPPASGISIVRFTSGSTVTVLTLPSTVKFPEWFDPTSLETNTIYEICVTDGVYGAVMSWAQ